MDLQAVCGRLTEIKQTVSSQLVEDQNQLTLSIEVGDAEVAAIPFLADESPVCSGPSEWLKRKNAAGAVHEPGLIATLIWLSEQLRAQSVTFYDIGALYGYHGFIAKGLIDSLRVVAVEGNPDSAAYIQCYAIGDEKFSVVAKVLGKEERRDRYLVKGFRFFPSGKPTFFAYWLRLQLKRCVNAIRKHPRPMTIKSFELETTTLVNILEPSAEGDIEIFKIDAEGYQAVFLPPAVETLCQRSAIVLMELDHPEQMKQFQTNNQSLVAPFIKKGYVALWMDHRDASAVTAITEISTDLDRNSLVVLIPPLIKSQLVSS